MAAIKRFFEKKKLDVKFKKAGGGHKLTEDTRSVPSVSAARGSNVTVERRARNAEETRKAAEAALARINQPRPGTVITVIICTNLKIRFIIKSS